MCDEEMEAGAPAVDRAVRNVGPIRNAQRNAQLKTQIIAEVIAKTREEWITAGVASFSITAPSINLLRWARIHLRPVSRAEDFTS